MNAPSGRHQVVVIGAGLTGLGAGHRFAELGHDDWVVLEATDRVGGLARSETDAEGFTYDIGGHVIFGRDPYWNRLLDQLMAGDHVDIQRQAWVHTHGRDLPYPFQEHLRYLDADVMTECVDGLLDAGAGHGPGDFAGWIDATFGAGIARHFMVPYNRKVWATPLERMSVQWIADRVPVVDLHAVLRNIVLRQDTTWGPNATFRYPSRGGTGHLAERLAAPISGHIRRATPVVEIHAAGRRVRTADGGRWPYEVLLNTMPLDRLIECTVDAPAAVRSAAARLRSIGTQVVGIGLDRPVRDDRNWVYFPDPEIPFHRLTYLSNYSPHLTPRPDQSILLTETSFAPEDGPGDDIVDRVAAALVDVGVLDPTDMGRIASTWRCDVTRSYPVPTLDRDEALAVIEPWLARHGIHSRGRLGAWRYEIGNMDHSVLQGVEFADALVTGAPERTWAQAVTG